MAKTKDEDRARRTLYVTGFDPKRATKDLLKELFIQGGPVVDITMFDTHAYVLFQQEESVPYCLALFNEIELHGQKLRLSPRFKTKDTLCYLQYLAQVRNKFRDDYMKQTPPDLPAKIYSTQKSRSHNRKYNSNSGGRKKTEQPKARKKRKRGKGRNNHN